MLNQKFIKIYISFTLFLLFNQPTTDNCVLSQSSLHQSSYKKSDYESILNEERYFALLKTADEKAFKIEFEPEILLLLDETQKKNYLQSTSLDERKSFIEFYWKALNPNPLMPENDRLSDHLIRRAYARKNFAMNRPPYFDDRGKYYIKYGKPHFRFQDPGGPRSIKSLVSIPFNYYSTLPNESWSYVNISPNYVVHFALEDSVYKEIKSLKSVITGNQRRNRLIWYWSDILKNRFWLSPLINESVTEFIHIENQLLISSGARSVVVDDFTNEQLENSLYSNLHYSDIETKKASLDVVPSVYRPINARNSLPMTVDIAQFRGPQGDTRVEIFYLSSLKNYIKNSDLFSSDSLSIEYSCMFRDQSFNTITSARQNIQYPLAMVNSENLVNAVGHVTAFVPAQESYLNLQVKDNQTNYLGYSQESLTIRDFGKSSLMMSDIQFYAIIENPNLQRMLSAIQKQNVMLAPYPFTKIKKSKLLYCYFEIYNLKSIGQDQDFDITYKIYKDETRLSIFKKFSKLISDKKDPSISIVYSQPITENISQQLIAIDLGKLSKDTYQLEIQISDPNDDSVIVSSKREFALVD